jgi:hypothetical protein
MPTLNVFAGVGAAKVYDSGNYLKPGKYLLELDKMILKTTQRSGLGWILELKVLESSDLTNHPVGSSATFFQKMTDRTIAASSCKEVMLALLNIDKNNPSEMVEFESSIDDILFSATGDEGGGTGTEFAGRKIGVEVSMITTKKGLPFSKHRWEPVEQYEE